MLHASPMMCACRLLVYLDCHLLQCLKIHPDINIDVFFALLQSILEAIIVCWFYDLLRHLLVVESCWELLVSLMRGVHATLQVHATCNIHSWPRRCSAGSCIVLQYVSFQAAVCTTLGIIILLFYLACCNTLVPLHSFKLLHMLCYVHLHAGMGS